MHLSSWMSPFQNRIRKSIRLRRRAHDRSIEQMEQRTLLTVTGVLIGSELSIFATANDAVTVRQGASGKVEVATGSGVVNTIPSIQSSALTKLTINAGDGNNAISVSTMTSAQFSALTGIVINAGNGNDTITGSDSFGESINAGDGADVIVSNAGNDTIDGGNGNDSISSGIGNDSVIAGDGNDTVDSGVGNDNINAGDGNDTVTAGDGDDTVDGGQGADTLNGGIGNDSLQGSQGADRISGDTGNDTVFGGSEDDTITGGDGSDQLNGNAGLDSISGDGGNDAIVGGAGANALLGGDGDDTITGDLANDTISGGVGNDNIYGGAGNDSLDGGVGDDFIFGNAGNDTLGGGQGSDLVNGGAGDDVLSDLGTGASTLPTLSIAGGGTVTEGNTGSVAVQFTVTLSAPSTSIVSVSIATIAGSATSSDFAPVNQVLTFSPGQTSQTFSASVLGDLIGETAETFFLTLSNATNASLLQPEASVTITDNDGPTLGLLASSFAGGLFQVDMTDGSVSLLGQIGQGTQTLAFTTSGTLFSTRQGPPPILNQVNQNPVGITAIGTLTPAPANFIEGDIAYDTATNTFYAVFTGTSPNLLQIDPATGATTDLGDILIGGQAISTVVNVDALAFRQGQLYLIIPDGVAAPNASFNDSLLRIDIATRQLTNIGPLGFDLPDGAAGMTYDSITDSFYLVAGSSAIDSNLYRVNPVTGAATLIGNTGIRDMSGLTFGPITPPAPVTLSISNATVVEGNLSGNSVAVTVTLSAAQTRPVQVDFATQADSASAGSDYIAISGTLTFAPGQLTQTINIPLTSDLSPELSETFTVRLSNASRAQLANSIGTVTISDDDIDLSANTLLGGVGNDTITGGDGNDIINGNENNDTIDGRTGDDSIAGGTGNDSLVGGDGDDTIDGQAGNDTLAGGNDSDTYVWAGTSAGNDVLADNVGFQTLIVQGDAAGEAFTVGQTTSVLRVSETSGATTATLTANNTITNVIINASTGDDNITIQSTNNVRPLVLTINGEDGNDTVNGTGAVLGSVLLRINGGIGNDTLTGTTSGETISGDAGADVIVGNAGNDVIDGGDGIDNLRGNDGNDTVRGGLNDDSIFGDLGNDSLVGGGGNDVLDGGGNNDVIEGGDGDDNLVGDSGTSNFGDDTLRGGNGNDIVIGGAGNDALDGGVGNDVLRGNSGNDQMKGGDGDDTIGGDAGVDTVSGGDGNDIIDMSVRDKVAGTALTGDIVDAGDGNDTITGSVDKDTLIGGDGHDIINGAAGSDYLYGGDGDDLMTGGGSLDFFNGGEGTNTFGFENPATAGYTERDDQTLVISASVLQALAKLNGF